MSPGTERCSSCRHRIPPGEAVQESLLVGGRIEFTRILCHRCAVLPRFFGLARRASGRPARRRRPTLERQGKPPETAPHQVPRDR